MLLNNMIIGYHNYYQHYHKQHGPCVKGTSQCKLITVIGGLCSIYMGVILYTGSWFQNYVITNYDDSIDRPLDICDWYKKHRRQKLELKTKSFLREQRRRSLACQFQTEFITEASCGRGCPLCAGAQVQHPSWTLVITGWETENLSLHNRREYCQR